MCGRFAITLPPDAMAQLFEAVPANDLPPVPNYNVCPTNHVHVVTGDARRLVSMRWGLIPHWYKAPSDGPLLINARAETVAEKPAFRAAVRERRCLIPASGFYEWTEAPTASACPGTSAAPTAPRSPSPGCGRTGGRSERRAPAPSSPAPLRADDGPPRPDAGDPRSGGLAALAGRGRATARRR